MKKRSNNGQSRIVRINDEILKEVSNLINYEVKDPRLEEFITVTKVDTSNDLSYCKVYISVFGNNDKKEKVLAGLKSASGFIRREIARRINLRQTPEFSFMLDDSIEYANKMNRLIKEATSTLTSDDE